MSLSETYTAIGDEIRRQYGTNDKYHLADMPTLIDNLEVKNLLEAGQTFDSEVNPIRQDFQLKGATLDDWNLVSGKTITISFDVTWTGYQYDSGGRNRVGIEYYLVNDSGIDQCVGVWLTPSTANGTEHVFMTQQVISGKITKIDEGNFYTQLNVSSLKATNLKIVENPIGGVELPSLIVGWPNNVSCNFTVKASVVTPFQIMSEPLIQGDYKIDFTIKGSNTNGSCVGIFNFSEDGQASNVFPWSQNFNISNQYQGESFTFKVPEDKKYRLIIYSTINPATNVSGKEMVFLKDIKITKIN